MGAELVKVHRFDEQPRDPPGFAHGGRLLGEFAESMAITVWVGVGALVRRFRGGPRVVRGRGTTDKGSDTGRKAKPKSP